VTEREAEGRAGGGLMEGGHFLDLYGWLAGWLTDSVDSGLSPESE